MTDISKKASDLFLHYLRNMVPLSNQYSPYSAIFPSILLPSTIMRLLITIDPAQVYQLCSKRDMDANMASFGKAETL